MVALRARMQERYTDWRDDLPVEPVGPDGQPVPSWRAHFAECPALDVGAIREGLEIADDAPVWLGRRNHRPNAAPIGSHVCLPFDGIEPAGVRVVVLGEDPYPSISGATVRGSCQTDSNQSQFPADSVNLPGTKLAPLGESGGAVELEILSRVEVALRIEMIVH